jgi:hypothetical protein
MEEQAVAEEVHLVQALLQLDYQQLQEQQIQVAEAEVVVIQELFSLMQQQEVQVLLFYQYQPQIIQVQPQVLLQ